MFRSLFALFVAFISVLSISSPLFSATADRPPNVVYIMADDLGYGELGCYGQKWIKTPNIDRLADEGIMFTQHYSGNAVCAPSRCCLMTGKHAGHAFIRSNRPCKPSGKNKKELRTRWSGQYPISDETFTVAEMLKKKGYATAAIGKWGLGNVGNEGDPQHQGFDVFYGFLCQRHAHNHYPKQLWHNGKAEDQPGNTRTLTGDTYSQDQLTRVALQFIRDNRDRPFFLYLPVIIPHLSIQVTEESLDEYRGKIPEADYKHKGSYLKHPAPRAGYAAMISHLDRDVGKIMTLLKELGLDDNTLVIFTSDNGPTYKRLGGSDSEFFNSAAGLRGLKGSLYEGGIRVPMVARWPGKIKPGTTTDLVSAFWDVMPTLADVAGIKAPEDTDGISYLPTLLGHPEQQKDHPFLYWEFPSYGGQQVVRMGDWKGVRQGLRRWKKPGLPPMELYNLAADPSEKHNVAAEHPDVVEQIEKIMQQEHEPSKLFPLRPIDK